MATILSSTADSLSYETAPISMDRYSHEPVPTSLDASNRFKTAIERLKHTLSTNDATAFAATTSEDVWKAAEDIQETQRKRRSLRNMRRVEPFLKALAGYSGVIEVACNGTPYLPWIWVSIHILA